MAKTDQSKSKSTDMKLTRVEIKIISGVLVLIGLSKTTSMDKGRIQNVKTTGGLIYNFSEWTELQMESVLCLGLNSPLWADVGLKTNPPKATEAHELGLESSS